MIFNDLIESTFDIMIDYGLIYIILMKFAIYSKYCFINVTFC